MVQPRALREDIERARHEAARARHFGILVHVHDADERKKATALPPNWILQRMPSDLLIHIATCCASTADLARLNRVCHALRTAPPGEQCSIVEHALRLRAITTGHPIEPHASLPADEPTWISALLAREVLRTLEGELASMHDGCHLVLSVRTNTGYDGVTNEPWKRPWAYTATVDGVKLGSFITAVQAAVAVAQFRWVQDHPCL